MLDSRLIGELDEGADFARERVHPGQNADASALVGIRIGPRFANAWRAVCRFTTSPL